MGEANTLSTESSISNSCCKTGNCTVWKKYLFQSNVFSCIKIFRRTLCIETFPSTQGQAYVISMGQSSFRCMSATKTG